MHKEKESLLEQYHQLTQQLIKAAESPEAESIHTLLDERQTCMAAINQLDQTAGQILMSPALSGQLALISLLESELKQKLQSEQQKILSNIHALKKEKNRKQYGEAAYTATSGLFLDKRK